MSISRNLLPVGDTISTAWDKVSGSKMAFWGALITLFAISLAIGFITGLATEAFHIFGRFLGFIGSIITTLLGVGLLYMGIRRANDSDIRTGHLFHALNFDMGISVIGVFVIQALLALLIGVVFFFLPAMMGGIVGGLLGILLYIIGGICIAILTIRISLGIAFVLDKDLDAIEAIKQSFAATRDNFWRILFVNVIMMVIVGISAIPFGIGLIWTLPMGYITYGLIYRSLLVNANPASTI